MTNDQTAMLQRVLDKHLRTGNDGATLAAMRELLLAVQERDAKLCLRSRACPNYHCCHKQDELAIRAQTYADLFPSTQTEEE